MTNLGIVLGSNFLTRGLISLCLDYRNKKLQQTINGIQFKNPIGLSAGFDKNAKLTKILPSVGFGFAEVGSITGEPCEGNPPPRLWRLPKSEGLVVYYGLKNKGCIQISKQLQHQKFKIPIGVSIAKTNSSHTVDVACGVEDYAKSYTCLAGIGNFFVINISCPNTFGGEPFTDPQKLEILLKRLEKIPVKKPVFLKLSPDITNRGLDAIIVVVKKFRIDGFISTNLTKDRKTPLLKDPAPIKGGLSGRIVKDLSTRQIGYLYKKTKGAYTIIGVGGVFSALDAYEKICAGASLVELITGMIFEGPQIISEINRGLVKLLERDGFSNISEAVGSKWAKH